MDEPWREVADRVYVRRHRSVHLNVGLVVGDGACLVVDTRMSHREARDLAAAIRTVTPHPWTVVNTHAHFDHYFGNAVFRPAPVWGHARCAERIREYGEVHRTAVLRLIGRDGDTALAADVAEVEIDPPERTFTDTATVDIGGRTVHLRHIGRGHTDSDIVLEVPDADVLFAGDLVEEGGPPAFGDSFPLDWPSTVDTLRGLVRGAVVPGHGDVVDLSYVEGQAGELAEVARLAREAFGAGRTVEQAWPDMPFPEEFARDALTRAYRQLRADPPYDPPDRWLATVTPEP